MQKEEPLQRRFSIKLKNWWRRGKGWQQKVEMQKLSVFSHQKIDAGSSACYFQAWLVFLRLCSDGERGEKLCKSRGVVPSWAATALLQAKAQQSHMAVQTRLSYSDRMNIKEGYSMARMPFRKASKAWWSCPLSCYTSLCSFLCDPLKTWATSLNFQDKTDPCVSHGTCSWHVNATFLSVQHVNIQGDEEKQKRRILIQLQIISHQRKMNMDLQNTMELQLWIHRIQDHLNTFTGHWLIAALSVKCLFETELLLSYLSPNSTCAVYLFRVCCDPIKHCGHKDNAQRDLGHTNDRWIIHIWSKTYNTERL